MDPSPVHLSKFLSLVLRHHPERIGLELDDEWWADVDDLVARARAANVPLTHDTLRDIVAKNDKQRFAFSADARRIRASHGHSIPVDLRLTAASPPELLYHGTAKQFVDSVRQGGLAARRRTHVHLSADADTARAVGQRHGKPVVLTVNAAEMERDGLSFYQAPSGVWLTESVPARYIVFPD
jgi:putative RNA 2'-phosphotransferase